MASISLSARNDLIALYTAMFKAAPNVSTLNDMVLQSESGKTIFQIAASLATKADFAVVYPPLLTKDAFVAKIVADLLPAGTIQGALDYATNWVTSQLNAKVPVSDIFAAAVAALRTSTNPDFATAQTQLNNKVTVASYYAVDKLGASTDLTTLQNVISGVTSVATTIDTAKAAVDGVVAAAIGQTYSLTTGVDTITGTAGNDTINASNTTLTALDTINGGDGTDTLNYNDVAGATGVAGVVISNVETAVIRSGGNETIDSTTWTGLTSLKVAQVVNAVLTASSTTDVTVAGATGTIGIDGGKDVSVTDSTAGKTITVGATTVNSGAITVTDSNVGAAAIAVDGGTNVALTLTGSSGSTITVGNGGAATDLPSGTITVVSNNKAVAGTDETLSAITVKGGSTITVAETATSSVAASDTTGATVTQGTVTVVDGNSTTSVSVSQSKSTTEVPAVVAIAGVTETASVKFTTLVATKTIILGGLTLTASADMTANEVAAAFASIASGGTQSGVSASKAVYTGSLTGWSTGAASGDTVVFTSTTANTDVANLADTGTGTGHTITTTAGSAATAAKTGVLGVINGVVTIDENATASITTVSVDGYGDTSTIGNTTTLSKLSTLSLANSGGATAGATNGSMTVDAAGVATLGLTLNNIKGAVSLDGAADSALKTLNVTTANADSSFALTAASVETLTVKGAKKATFSADLAALKTVTVSETASLALSGNEANTLTSVNSSATTGSVTATIDGTLATYTGGAGVDTVTLTTGTALTKAIDLGAGDDTLKFGVAVTGSTATLSGGDGTDSLSMTVANADALDAGIQTFYTNFERLVLNDAAGDNDNTADTVTIDVAKLGFTNYVTTNGTLLDTTTSANSDTLVLDNVASGATVVVVAAAAGADTKQTINVKDAATGTADSLNVTLSSAGALNAGVLTVANVESISLTTSDTDTTAHTDTLTLTANKATSLTLAGNAALSLTLTGSVLLTSIDGSTRTAALTVTSVNTTSATTIKGGSAADTLTAATGNTADVLIGGAGNDTLNANGGMDTLTGGAGNDTFVIGSAQVNVNSYATITDFAAGDKIKFTGASGFKAAKVSLGDTAVFQDYANAAINAVTADNGTAWFQFGGNTYIVAETDNATNSDVFVNNEDKIVKLTGLVDLSTASFNDTSDTISL